MEKWLRISLLLSAFGFLKEFRPSEHFIFDFLSGPWRNITKEQINQDVYPIMTYSYLAQLFIVFLITDLCRYKSLIITLGASGIVVFSLLLWTTSLLELQIVEVMYGTMMATEVAYYTYMYAKVPKEHYQQVTGHTRAGILVGRFLSGLVAQLLISYQVMDVRDLNYISLGALILATIWAFFLPSVSQSIYFHQVGVETDYTFKQKWVHAFRLLYNHFISSYNNIHVIKWSVWWAMATCGFLTVWTYMQPLWDKVDPNGGSGVYNGAVEAILTLLGTGGAILAGFIKADWSGKAELALCACSIIEGAVLLVASQTNLIFLCYGCYIIFGSLYHFMITIVSAEIAKNILEDSYGLVFGLNTILALILQTFLLLIFISEDGFNLAGDPRNQFVVYGSYFMIIALIFFVMGVMEWVKMRRNRNK